MVLLRSTIRDTKKKPVGIYNHGNSVYKLIFSTTWENNQPQICFGAFCLHKQGGDRTLKSIGIQTKI